MMIVKGRNFGLPSAIATRLGPSCSHQDHVIGKVSCIILCAAAWNRLFQSPPKRRRVCSLTFRGHTGVGPHQDRLHLNLSHARDPLLNRELSGKEITFGSGFEEEQYFRCFVKKAMGRAPDSYRKR